MYDVIIIGSGPAGLTAAIYTTRDNLKTLIIAGTKWGGQLQLTTLVENFPGFPEGIQGPELMSNMRKQAEHFGAEIVDADFTSGDFSKSPFKITAGGKEYIGKSIIIATGADTKWLGVPGEKEKIGHGVSTCAPCDAPFFRNKNVMVVGGGDAAMEEALVLTEFASLVTVVHRREEFRACTTMLEKAKQNPKIKFLCCSEIVEVLGENKVTGVKVRNTKTKEISEVPIDGIFVAISRVPNSKVFKGIDVDEKGYIKVDNHNRTNVEGVFAAGDVQNRNFQQAIVAAGFGAQAALEAQHYLENLK
jgi:thioredoxin reductase (NADPH)